jgi:hypothetical protein
MSNEAKAVCTGQLAAFFAQGHRAATAAALPGVPYSSNDSHSARVRYTISPSSGNRITQTLLFIKKKTAHDHSALCYGLFVRITPTRLCLNTFGVSCGQKFSFIVSFGPRDRSAATRLRVHVLCHGRHGPALHHPYDHCDHARGSLKCDRREP